MDKKTCANAIRALSMDAVQQAKSGHPGAPMGMADIAELVWRDHLKHNPKNPTWSDRDRFVLSNGHGSMLLYSLLHLSGYDVSIDDLKQFRQLNSKTPGHPEFGHTPGIETTTGPLGQGFANAVGMAIAEKTLACQYNQEGHTIIDHKTWVFLGDGCLMEGISHEVGSLAGTLKLGKLIAVWDDNNISIDGKVGDWFSDDTAKRFEAYGWHVIRDVDGHDPLSIESAIQQAKQDTDRPSLICAKTNIGQGSPNLVGTAKVHGAPLGPEEIELTRAALGWNYPPFEIPSDVYQAWDACEAGASYEQHWTARWNAYQAAFPELAASLERRLRGDLPDQWHNVMDAFIQKAQSEQPKLATRQASQKTIEQMAAVLPELLGGSADLAHSNLTVWPASRSIATETDGNYIHYGVREFGMSAMMNGIALHGGFIPFGGTFLIFMEYARNAVRMAALMNQRSIFVYTHDSVGLGEDGPTHQPVEQIETLRCMPNLAVWRPCDMVESAVAWKAAVERSGPSALCFSRQGLPTQPRTPSQLENILRGAYVLKEGSAALIIATGSEVALAMEAAEALDVEGISTRVVSMPSQDCFDAQSKDYQQSVIPDDLSIRVAVEAGVRRGWMRYVNRIDQIIGIDQFGLSAPADQVFAALGLTRDQIILTIKKQFN